MKEERTIADRLRKEYFELLPDIRRVAEHLEAEVKYTVLPICRKLDQYERLTVTSRVKECESALDSLRRRQEGGTFDDVRPSDYTLTSLNDLAGVRVLAFPRSRLSEIDRELRKRFMSWKADHVVENRRHLALKYYGHCEASSRVRGEYQIMSMLVGLFWEVEHSALYKPTPKLKGIDREPQMRQRRSEVYTALKAFEDEFKAQFRSKRPQKR